MPIDLLLDITYEPANRKFKIEGNAKDAAHYELISEFLRSQIGAGADKNPPNQKPVYKIKIGLDLSEDRFYVESDTGNKSLREGILLDICSRLESESRSEWELS